MVEDWWWRWWWWWWLLMMIDDRWYDDVDDDDDDDDGNDDGVDWRIKTYAVYGVASIVHRQHLTPCNSVPKIQWYNPLITSRLAFFINSVCILNSYVNTKIETILHHSTHSTMKYTLNLHKKENPIQDRYVDHCLLNRHWVNATRPH